MDRRRVATVVLALVVASLVATAFTGSESPPREADPPADRLVQPVDGEGYVWPYTSRERSIAGRTLPINVVVTGKPDRVRRVLAERSDVNWTGADPDVGAADPPWRPATGAARYTYVTDDPDVQGKWTRSGYQLGVGSYFSTRVHARAYPAPSTNWTAIQAHTEYWDWFRLRHTVTSTAAGARFVERDLREEPVSTDLRREYHGLGGSSNSGWISVIEIDPTAVESPENAIGYSGPRVPSSPAGPGPVTLLTLLTPAGIAGFAVRRRFGAEADRYLPDGAETVLLPVALVGIVLGVRAVGVVGEAVLSPTNPQLFAGAIYPVLALGPLVVTTRLTPSTDPIRAAALAAGGLGAGIVIDFSVTGVAAVPIQLALHRIALVGALAVVAVGVSGSDSDRRLVTIGVGAWLIALALPLAAVI